MQINHYPRKIADLEMQLFKAATDIEIQSELLKFLDLDIESAIANDATLKNEQQRKAKRLQMQQEPDYLESLTKLKDLKSQRETLTIQLNQLRNEFSVAKLEMRMAIAQMEVTAA